MFAFAYFRIPDGLSQAIHITRWVADLALIAFNWWVKTEARHVIEDYGRLLLHSFNGVFEMAPHPMYSVGVS